MKCRKCNSSNCSFAKAIFRNNTHHYYLGCNNCYFRCNVKPDDEVYEATKNQEWLKKGEVSKFTRRYTIERTKIRKEKRKTEKKREVEELPKLPYKEYLQDEYWKKIRASVRKRDKRCRVCNSIDRLETHHRSYKHKGDYNKERKDLILLCHDCHSLFHRRSFTTK